MSEYLLIMKSTSLKKSSLINELKFKSLEFVKKLCLNISAYPFKYSSLESVLR